MAKVNRKHLHQTKAKDQSFDKFVLVFGFVEPLFIIPQVYKIYSTHNASGLSLLTWCLYVLSSLVLVVWGIRRNLKPIYFPQIAWIIFEIIVVIGIIKYG